LQAEVDELRVQLALKEQQLAAAAEAVAAADDKIVSDLQHYSTTVCFALGFLDWVCNQTCV
jgi:hypothetical protein